MQLSSLRRQPTLVDVGPAGYQEFTAGTIPVRGVLADEEGALVLVEHQRGVMRAFDGHLGAVRTGGAPRENVDYNVTWTAITGWEPWPPVVRLELRIDGLNARPRLLFKGETMLPLWLLADGACFGLVLDPRGQGRVSALSCMWFLGPTPAAEGLARILGGSDQQNGAGPEAAAPANGEPVGVSASEGDGSATADDLPF
jgi:hypothetical protein